MGRWRKSPGPETVGHTHHSLSCALICEQERQLRSQFSLCSPHPSGYLWLQSWGLAPGIGRIGPKASLCVALPTRSSQSRTCGRRWNEEAKRTEGDFIVQGDWGTGKNLQNGNGTRSATRVCQSGPVGREEGGVCREVRGMA